MIKNRAKLDKFYQKLMREEKIPYSKALRIYEMLHKEAVRLGVINSKNILDGLEVSIRIARAIQKIS